MFRDRWDGLAVATLLLFIGSWFSCAHALFDSEPHGAQVPLVQDDEGLRGAVASENRLCSQVGIDLLRDGGNAADALVGTVLCVGVIGMYHSGIGGGGFMLVRDSHGNYESVDFRETAPAASHVNMFKNNVNASLVGGLASGVPGEIRGLEYLHKKYGALSWEDVLTPAIHLARDGFNVTKDLFRYMQSASKDTDFLSDDPDWAIDFAPNGTLVGLGDFMTRRRYADTLQAIAKGGADVFYNGAMADATIQTIQRHGGVMTAEDLRTYEVKSRPALDIEYRGFRLFGCGVPAMGSVVFSAMKTIEGYEDIGNWSAINMSTHRLDEAFRFAYGERGSLGDPDFVEGVVDHEADMISGTRAAHRRGKISDDHTLNVSDYNPDGYEVPEQHGTSHVVTADASGMAISLTTTLNLIFGSHVVIPSTGVIMNDEMNDFSVPHRKNAFGYAPSPSNYIRPRKRPLSSITPVIVEHLANRSLYYVVGAAGGSRIPTATVQNLWHILDHGLNASAGLAMPRLHDQLLPNIIGFEWSSDNHTLHDRPKVPGDDGDDEGDGINAASENEKDGCAELLRAGAAWSNAEDYDDYSIYTKGRSESGIGTGYIEGFDNRTVAFMCSRGHNVTWIPPGYSSAQAIRLLWNGTFEASGEPRQADSGGFEL